MDKIVNDIDITTFNELSSSFDFLADEPDIYSRADLKKKIASKPTCPTSDVGQV
jgi:hypothetical protein